eukprot:TRINITY_DN29090_c0_g1_i1.p1 TRINITY_DN29090_c0_g1~~TRINITY_DN29090_c0_g1_i1.p1  ORF type:complete len:172 (-),score=28.52 TRINITY_DN29090_c0_g1_i1:45-560(-)
MGGPCWLKKLDDDGEYVYSQGPDCTDNFQVRPFLFDGREWQSVEQCYQAMSFRDRGIQEKLRAIRKFKSETNGEHGVRVWQEVQNCSDRRGNWDAIKVEIMYRANLSKYLQHPDLQAELVSTGTQELEGAARTSWTTKEGTRTDWSIWNGKIQMRIREEPSRLQSEHGQGN